MISSTTGTTRPLSFHSILQSLQLWNHEFLRISSHFLVLSRFFFFILLRASRGPDNGWRSQFVLLNFIRPLGNYLHWLIDNFTRNYVLILNNPRSTRIAGSLLSGSRPATSREPLVDLLNYIWEIVSEWMKAGGDTRKCKSLRIIRVNFFLLVYFGR